MQTMRKVVVLVGYTTDRELPGFIAGLTLPRRLLYSHEEELVISGCHYLAPILSQGVEKTPFIAFLRPVLIWSIP